MTITVAHSAPFIVMVYRVDIIRLQKGPDHLYLRTNLPNPVWPYTGTLSIRLATTRGQGRQWVRDTFKKQPIEVTEADLETLPKPGDSPGRSGAPEDLLSAGETVASDSGAVNGPERSPDTPTIDYGALHSKSGRTVLALRRK